MTLEQIARQRTLIKKLPPPEVEEAVAQAKKLIIVQDDFSQVPEGYILLKQSHRGQQFNCLVPKQLLFFMANPGEGDNNEALDSLADFYNEAEDIETGFIQEGTVSAQEAGLATHARSAYGTYATNSIVTFKNDGKEEPEFDTKTLEQLGINDPYVNERIKAIAALALGKQPKDLKEAELGSLLKHVTIQKESRRKLSREEIDHVACYAGSHWEIKPEYQKKEGERYCVRGSKESPEGHATSDTTKTQVLDAKISEIEKQIIEYQRAKGKTDRHDNPLLRQYINLAYIAKENPNAQLDITPPKEEKCQE